MSKWIHEEVIFNSIFLHSGWQFSWRTIKLGQSSWGVVVFLITNQYRTNEASQVADLPVCNGWKKSERPSTPMGLKVWLGTITWELAGNARAPAPLHIFSIRNSASQESLQVFWYVFHFESSWYSSLPSVHKRVMEAQEGKISFFRITLCNNWTMKRYQIYHFLALCHYFASLSFSFLL